MFYLYLFTFTFVSLLGSYESLEECVKQAKSIQSDYHYNRTVDFTMFCVNSQNKNEYVILENEKASFPKGTGKLL